MKIVLLFILIIKTILNSSVVSANDGSTNGNINLYMGYFCYWYIVYVGSYSRTKPNQNRDLSTDFWTGFNETLSPNQCLSIVLKYFSNIQWEEIIWHFFIFNLYLQLMHQFKHRYCSILNRFWTVSALSSLSFNSSLLNCRF